VVRRVGGWTRCGRAARRLIVADGMTSRSANRRRELRACVDLDGLVLRPYSSIPTPLERRSPLGCRFAVVLARVTLSSPATCGF